MLSEVSSSKGRAHAVETPHARRHHHKPVPEFPSPPRRTSPPPEAHYPCSPVPSVVKILILTSLNRNHDYFFLTLVPIRKSFLTVPVGSRFI
jgi:hypothetical protein